MPAKPLQNQRQTWRAASAILVALLAIFAAPVGMGQKYLPTIRDQKAAQRFQWQQRQRTEKEQPAAAPEKTEATKTAVPKRAAK